MQFHEILCCLVIVLTATACSRSTREIPPDSSVIEHDETSVDGTSREDSTRRTYVVQSGDTLFSIAWRHELDLRDLIEWNGLQNPDLILIGQSLFLEPAGTVYSIVADEVGDAVLEDPAIRPDVSANNGQELPPTPISSLEGPVADSSKGSQATPSPGISASLPLNPDSPWIWPTVGPLVSPYGATQETGDGIGIGGVIGADVRAAAPGEVVYAGRGLAAYGNLLILKHNDSFLSAYGHNDELLVGEGEAVAQGQVIARMGLGPERQPQLHFEIRRNGTPVDPTNYLPK